MRTQRFTRAIGAAGKMVALIAAGSAGLSAQDAAGTTFTPTGFLSATAVSRTTSNGTNLPTSFGTVPYDNTIQGNAHETRFSAADTTLGVKVSTQIGEAKIKGYACIDFLGNDASNVYVTSNSHTARLRLAYLDAFVGDWEFLGGQAYSWVTPNRVGLSADPADVFTSRNVDPSNQVGMAWTRAAQFRVAYHPSQEWAFGLALESPDQYVGAGEVIFPYAFNAQLGVQIDANNNLAGSGKFPDVIAKGAYDSPERALHVEGVALYRRFSVTTLDAVPNTSFTSKSTSGASFGLNASGELFHGFRLLASGFTGEGGGRYIGGLGPDFVVEPDATGTTISLSTVKSKAYLGGLEWEVSPADLVAAYYGADSFDRNAFTDTSNPNPTKPVIGFGGTNSPNAANRTVREYTVDYQRTLWSEAGKGAVKMLFQASHVRREAWFVAAGAPENAQSNVYYMSMRYIFP